MMLWGFHKGESGDYGDGGDAFDFVIKVISFMSESGLLLHMVRYWHQVRFIPNMHQ